MAWGQGEDHEKMEALKAQARTHSGSRDPNLVRDHRYYAEQAADTSLPKAERKLWAQLEEETATRLGLHAPPSKQEELW